MRRKIAAISILAVSGGVGWRVSRHPERSARLEDVRLDRRSERSRPGPTELAGIRIRIMANDAQISVPAKRVPQIALAAD